MTPLASQLFRHGDEEDQKLLAKCQFFECTKIMDMAQEMGFADVEAGGSDYSLMAQLPSPFTAIEAHTVGGRLLLTCQQEGQDIAYVFWVPLKPGQPPQPRFSSGFRLGTGQNLDMQWAAFEGEPKFAEMQPEQIRTARGFNLQLEKLLCIINQPGLVQRVERDADKRVVKAAGKLPGRPDVSKFFECRIRAGRHGEQGGLDTSVEMPLHYVRKHLRPSSGKWIDGYWRGNADLGLHLKWYTPAVPGKVAR